MGLKQRNGKLQAEAIPNVQKETLCDVVARRVEPGAVVSTDKLYSYGLLEGGGYKHGAVKYGAKKWGVL